jgi:hypothetical protein
MYIILIRNEKYCQSKQNFIHFRKRNKITWLLTFTLVVTICQEISCNQSVRAMRHSNKSYIQKQRGTAAQHVVILVDQATDRWLCLSYPRSNCRTTCSSSGARSSPTATGHPAIPACRLLPSGELSQVTKCE